MDIEMRRPDGVGFIPLVSGPLQQVVTGAMAVLSSPQIATMTKKMRDAMDNNP
jgi:hypothetical protein